MKFFASILAIYFLSITILPCTDSNGKDVCGSEIHYHADSGHQDNTDIDFCSPFCSCQCCHTTIASQQTFYDIPVMTPDGQLNSYYTDHLKLEFIEPILHPPRI